jgi:hypothetical protein
MLFRLLQHLSKNVTFWLLVTLKHSNCRTAWTHRLDSLRKADIYVNVPRLDWGVNPEAGS